MVNVCAIPYRLRQDTAKEKFIKQREQEFDYSMSFDEHYMDTKVHETMDLLYEDQKTLPKKPLNRKPFIRNDGSGETNRSGKHVIVVKNDAEETAVDSMIRVLNESANEVLEETMNLILAAIKIVDYKRRREKNQASEQTTIKLNKENFLS
ncbi:hypothetical protein H5410_002012 [Solanum commersonii]|uniref:Uncharacterized protein n=1 Tax=Solanum commersonii TaxID=4109 RepID=A0A9J6B1P6_SOLCO|nr:hypothetical protein H5410_002012 [Solanum commersonii]